MENQSQAVKGEERVLEHGARPSKHTSRTGRRRKGACDYAAENRDDFTFRSVVKDGCSVNMLVCKYCAVTIGARSDRIKEHLSSKRHIKLKSEAVERGLIHTLSFITARNSAYNQTMAHAFGVGHVNGSINMMMASKGVGTDVGPGQNKDSHSPKSTSQGEGHQSKSQAVNDVSGVAVRRFVEKDGKLHLKKSPPMLIPTTPRRSKDSHYFFRWETHAGVFKDAFSLYQINGHFTDVTLAAQGQKLNCHKIVLAACSDYFFELLKDNPSSFPIIILKDTQFWELEALVQFMYHGEVIVKRSMIKSFLRTAEELKIRGLVKPTTTTPACTDGHLKNSTNNMDHELFKFQPMSLDFALNNDRFWNEGSNKMQMEIPIFKGKGNAQPSSTCTGRHLVNGNASSYHGTTSKLAFMEGSNHTMTSKDLDMNQFAHQPQSNQSPMISEENSQQSSEEFDSRKRKLDCSQEMLSTKTLRLLNQDQNLNQNRSGSVLSIASSMGSGSSDRLVIDLDWNNFNPPMQLSGFEQTESPNESDLQEATDFKEKRLSCDGEESKPQNERDNDDVCTEKAGVPSRGDGNND